MELKQDRVAHEFVREEAPSKRTNLNNHIRLCVTSRAKLDVSDCRLSRALTHGVQRAESELLFWYTDPLNLATSRTARKYDTLRVGGWQSLWWDKKGRVSW